MIFKVVGVVVYLLILVGIGLVASRRMRDIKDYFAGGKNLGFWAVAFSSRATGESAWLLLGLTGMGAMVGAKAFWVVLGEVAGVSTAWLLMSRRFNVLTRTYDAITIPDYLESRLRDRSHLVRLVGAITIVAFVTVYVAAQIDATGKAFESFLHWNYFVGAIVGFAVVLAYTWSGGFVAVVWSDVFQGSLMFLGLVALPIVGVVYMGGPSDIFTKLAAEPGLLSPAGPDGWSALTVFSIIGLVAIGVGFMGIPQIFVRFLALRDPSEVPKGAAVAITWTLLADSGAVLVGMVGRTLPLSPDKTAVELLGEHGEHVLPLSVEFLLPPLLVGLFIAIVLAAIMSTVDSLLVLAGSAAVRDAYQKVFRPDLPDDAMVGISRGVTIGLALVALAIAMIVALVAEDRSIFWFVIFGWSGLAATFCPTVILSLFWPGLTRNGALASMLTGAVAVPVFAFGVPKLPVVGPYFGALSELPPSFALATGVAVVVSLVDRPGRKALADAAIELRDAGRG